MPFFTLISTFIIIPPSFLHIANFVKKKDFDNNLKNVTSNKIDLNELSKKVKAISTKELIKELINKFSILNRAKYLSSGLFQNYLLFIPAKKYIKFFSGTTRIDLWKSNRMSVVNIQNITKSDSNFAPTSVDQHYYQKQVLMDTV